LRLADSKRTAVAGAAEKRSSDLRVGVVDVETTVDRYHAARRVERLLQTATHARARVMLTSSDGSRNFLSHATSKWLTHSHTITNVSDIHQRLV